MRTKNQELSLVIWEAYNAEKIQGTTTQLDDQTQLFLKQIPATISKEFEDSTDQVIHFGCGIGSYISSLPTPKTFIGYDYSPTAIQLFHNPSQKRFGKACDLNQIQGSTLVYHESIEADLKHPSNILMVRIIEYLDPSALILLLMHLIQYSKVDSTFYIEVAIPCDQQTKKKLTEIGHLQDTPKGYVASFFAPRIDMKFIAHMQETKDEHGSIMDVERFIVRKI